MVITPLKRPRTPMGLRPSLERHEYASAQESARENLWWQNYAEIEERFYWVLPLAFQPLARLRYMQNITGYLQGCAHVVDYGCGNGWIARALSAHLRSKITGLDFSSAQINLALTHARPPGSDLDFQTISGPQDLPPADAYVFHGILHHLPATEIYKLMQMVQRLAPSGARLVFVEPTCFPQASPTPEQQQLLDAIAHLVTLPAQALQDQGLEPSATIQKVRSTEQSRWWGQAPYGPSPLERPFVQGELGRVIAHYFDLQNTATVQFLPASQAVAGELALLAHDAPELAHELAPELLTRVDGLEQKLIQYALPPDAGWYMQLLTASVR